MIYKNKMAKYASLGLGTLFMMVSVAAADINTDLTNFTSIVTNFSNMMVSVLNLFLQPPLLYFTVLVIFVAIIGIAKRLMHAGGKK